MMMRITIEHMKYLVCLEEVQGLKPIDLCNEEWRAIDRKKELEKGWHSLLLLPNKRIVILKVEVIESSN